MKKCPQTLKNKYFDPKFFYLSIEVYNLVHCIEILQHFNVKDPQKNFIQKLINFSNFFRKIKFLTLSQERWQC